MCCSAFGRMSISMSASNKHQLMIEKVVARAARIRHLEMPIFQSQFEPVVVDIVCRDRVPTVADWLGRLLRHNVPGGKLNRGMTVAITFRLLHEADPKTPGTMEQARILGWCMELFQAAFLVADDLMDQSMTRRGKPCWYRVVGNAACNDAMMLESALFRLMRNFLSGHPCYKEMVELMHEGFLITSDGQCLDMLTEKATRDGEMAQLNLDRYREIVSHKTAFYSFVMPVRFGLYLAGIINESIHERIQRILSIVGELFQVQDDYLDCFGDVEITGKIGTDIQDGKCSWLVVKALQLANEQQVELIRKNYARHDERARETIKKLYQELELDRHFQAYQQDRMAEILAELEASEWPDTGVPVQIFDEPLSQVIGDRIK